MKKIYNLFLLSILTLSVICFSGCSNKLKNNCEHNLKVIEVIKEPTETEKGEGLYYCDKCKGEKNDYIPILNSKDYKVNVVEEASCHKNGKSIYESKVYGNYTVLTSKTPHTSYSGMCEECEEVINNLYFNPEEFVRVSTGGGYPRLYILSDGTWLCGYDTGKIMVARSEDEGKNWSSAVIASVHNSYTCANVAFYEFPNGDLLCAYRALGNGNYSNKREIQCTISKDKGETWEYHSTIEDNFEVAKELGYTEQDAIDACNKGYYVGFYEPHFGIINDELTVMYADDFTTMLLNPRNNSQLNYETQFIISRTYNEDTNTWENRKVIVDGTIKKEVSGITEYSRDGMPVFDRLSDGTYVLVVEGTYRRSSSNGNNPFIILLSYSKDGINWSTPKEIYVPKGSGSKASAPYVCVTSDDRIIVSFQTDEDCVRANKGFGDSVSIMKTIISDGTPIEEIDKNSFSEAVNVFGLNPGNLASWNGMYMHEDRIYCVSGVSGKNEDYGMNLSGIYIATSDIPKLENVGTYNDKETENSKYNYSVVKGEVSNLESGWMKVKESKTLLTFNDITLNKGTYSLDVIPNYYEIPQVSTLQNKVGMVFKVNEDNSSYYTFFINAYGEVSLGKCIDGKLTILESSQALIPSYSRLNRYHLSIEFDEGSIACNVNEETLFDYYDEDYLTGEKVGAYSYKELSLFNNPSII